MVADTVAIMESNMVADMEVDNVAIYIYNKYQKYKSVELGDQLSLPTSLRRCKSLALVLNIILKILKYQILK